MLAVYLWIVGQLVFYATLTNLSKFQQHIPSASKLFFLAHIFGNICVAIFSNFVSFLSSLRYSSIVNVVLLVILILYPHSPYAPSVFFVFNFVATYTTQIMYLYIPQLFESQVRSTTVSYSKIPAKIILIFMPFLLGNSVPFLYSLFATLLGSTPIALYLLL